MSHDKKQKKPSYAELQTQIETLNKEKNQLADQLRQIQEEQQVVDTTKNASSTLIQSGSLAEQEQEFNERIAKLKLEHQQELSSMSERQLEFTKQERTISELREQLAQVQADAIQASAANLEITAKLAPSENAELIGLQKQVRELTEQLMLEQEKHTQKTEETNLSIEAIKLAAQEEIQRLKAETSELLKTIEEMKAMIDSKSAATVTPTNSIADGAVEAEQAQLAIQIQKLQTQLAENRINYESLIQKCEDLTKDNESLNTDNTRLTQELGLAKAESVDKNTIVAFEQALETGKPTISPVFFAEAQARQQRALNAIKHLKESVSKANPPTEADKAILGIAKCLKEGLKVDNAQAYFDANKDLLKKHIGTLQYSFSSFVNTAVNAILTVLTVCSVVGIAALWLTGTLQSNAQKNGSAFSFAMFGQKQKVQREMHEVVSAMGLGMTKGG